MNRIPYSPIFIFIFGLTISITLVRFENDRAFETKLVEVSYEVERLTDELEKKREMTKQLLGVVSSFFNASEKVSKEEFELFVTPIIKENLFIKAIEWVPAINSNSRASFEKLIGQEIWEFNSKGEKVRASENTQVYYPVEYIVPQKGNEKSFGFDLGSEKNRRESLLHAERDQVMRSTEIVDLVQKGKGVLVISSVKNQHETGFIVAVIDLQRFIQTALFGSNSSIVELVVEYQGQNFYGNILETPYSLKKRYDFFDDVWTLIWYIPKSFIDQDFSLKEHIYSTLITLFTILVAIFSFYLSKKRVNIEELVLKRTADLRESEDRYRVLLNTVPNAVVTIDSSGKITFFSDHAVALFGYHVHEALGNHVSIIIPEPYKDKHDQFLKNYLKTGVKKVIGMGREVVAQKKNGEIFPVYLAVGEIVVGEKRYFTGVIHDISPQKKIEDDLIKAKDDAIMATKAKSEFLARMSHEIRTPLNAILGMSHILGETKLLDQQKEYVKTINNSGENLLFILNEILDLSKIESGKMALERNPFHLESTIRDIIFLMKPMALKKGLAISYHIEKGTPLGIISDSTRLSQVFLNVVGNAIKFTKEGSIQIHVKANQIKDDLYDFQFTVTDTGIGIARNEIDHLFQSFRQADPSISRKYGGTGLGLVISKKIIELMGGIIRIESILGEGSSLYFNVLERGTSDIALPERTDELLISELAKELPLRILVAEDNSINQKIVITYLERMGYIPDIASSGLEVIKSFENKEYDLVLMDLQMPEMDGFEATEKINQMILKMRPKIIAMTANVFKEDRKKCRDLGMVDFLPKPLRKSELELVIRRNFSVQSINEQIKIEDRVEIERQETESIIDESTLRIKFQDDQELFKEICDDLFKISKRQIEEIESSFATKDFNALTNAAHSLKSVVSNFESLVIRTALQEIEQFARDKNIEGLESSLPLFRKKFILFHDELMNLSTKLY